MRGPKEKCHDCKYFGNTGYRLGPCHRFPPLQDGFPQVGEYQWCGEFTPNEQEDN